MNEKGVKAVGNYICLTPQKPISPKLYTTNAWDYPPLSFPSLIVLTSFTKQE